MAQDLRRRLGQRIRALRTQRGLTQEALAEQASITWHFISSIERGVTGTTIETLAAIAEAFGVTLSELFLNVDHAQLREAGRVEALLAGRPVEVRRRILRLVEDAVRLHEST